MRHLIAFLAFACAACQPPQEIASARRQLAKPEISNPLDTKQRVHALGGTVVGSNMGEFGGDVSFIEPDGTTYQVIDDNSHGIFNTAQGVLAVTGLAHMSLNRGAVFLLSREPNKLVVATSALQLPGAPCDDVQMSGEKISLRTFIGNGDNGPSYRCFALQPPSTLVEQQCEPAQISFAACFD